MPLELQGKLTALSMHLLFSLSFLVYIGWLCFFGITFCLFKYPVTNSRFLLLSGGCFISFAPAIAEAFILMDELQQVVLEMNQGVANIVSPIVTVQLLRVAMINLCAQITASFILFFWKCLSQRSKTKMHPLANQ